MSEQTEQKKAETSTSAVRVKEKYNHSKSAGSAGVLDGGLVLGSLRHLPTRHGGRRGNHQIIQIQTINQSSNQVEILEAEERKH